MAAAAAKNAAVDGSLGTTKVMGDKGQEVLVMVFVRPSDERLAPILFSILSV